MNVKKSFVFAWGLSYIVCAFLSPDMVKNIGVLKTGAVFFIFGLAIIVGLFMILFTNLKIPGSIVLLGVGVIEVFGMCASWTGAITWSVGLPNQTMLQVSMALLDFLSAVVLISVSTETLLGEDIKQ